MIDLRDYKTFASSHSFACCWACGATQKNKPRWWNAPFIVERAHIVSHPRVKDIRVIVLLCSLCHGRSHGLTYSCARDWPSLTLPNKLWLKMKFDRQNYDRKFISKHNIGLLPRAVKPDKWFSQQWLNNTGKKIF